MRGRLWRWFIALFGGLKAARKVWAWARYVLVVLVAVGVGVGLIAKHKLSMQRARTKAAVAAAVEVQAQEYTRQFEDYQKTVRAKLKHKDEQINRLKRSKSSSTKVMERRVIHDPVTGNVIEEIFREAEAIDREDQWLEGILRQTANVDIKAPEAPKSPVVASPVRPAGFYPLGLFVGATHRGDFAAGVKWRLVPRLALPLLPDPSLSVALGGILGIRTEGLGLVLIDLHRR